MPAIRVSILCIILLVHHRSVNSSVKLSIYLCVYSHVDYETCHMPRTCVPLQPSFCQTIHSFGASIHLCGSPHRVMLPICPSAWLICSGLLQCWWFEIKFGRRTSDGKSIRSLLPNVGTVHYRFWYQPVRRAWCVNDITLPTVG
jgi:hypothetical protein